MLKPILIALAIFLGAHVTSSKNIDDSTKIITLGVIFVSALLYVIFGVF